MEVVLALEEHLVDVGVEELEADPLVRFGKLQQVAGPTIDGKTKTMFRGVLQRGESRAGEEEEEDPDVAAKEDGGLQLVQGLARGDPHAVDHRLQGHRQASTTC